MEVLGVTAASAVPTSGEAVRHAGTATGAAEIGGAEIIGMVGMRYLVDRTVSLAFGVTVDNNGAVLFRPGVSMTFPHF